MTAPLLANPWTPYGLRSDPFYQEPVLPADASPDDPHSLFVGRADEVRRLGSQILGAVSSRALLQGAPGIGKTSVVNRVKAALAEQGYLLHGEPIRVTGALTAGAFSALVLRQLIEVHATSARTTSPDPDHTRFWEQLTHRLLGQSTSGASASVAGVGVGRTPVRFRPEIEVAEFYADIARAFELLSDNRQRGTLIHIDNLERLSSSDASRVADLLLDLRDYFLVPYSHWLFVGAGDLRRTIFAPHPQLADIVPVVETLGPLSPAEVVELLRRRYLHLALPDTDPVPPVSEEAVHVLYPRFVAATLPHGTAATLRSFLRLLSQGMQRRALIAPLTPAEPEEVLGLTAEEYRRQLEDRIGPELVAAAAALAQGHRALDEVRQLEFQQATGVAKSTAQREWKQLLAYDVLYQTRDDRDGAWHRFSAEATVAFGML